MWENETVVLVTSLKKHLLGTRNEVRFEVIRQNKALPGFIKRIFAKRTERYLKVETPLTIRTTQHFKIDQKSAEEFKRESQELLRNSCIYMKDEVEEILKEGLVLRLDYLVKPVDTMRNYLFQNEMSIDTDKLESLLYPFRNILTYADDLITACEKKSLSSLSLDDYTRMIESLLPGGTSPESVTDVLKEVSILQDFLSETKGEDISRMDGSLLQAFLADRNLWGFRRALEVEMKLGRQTFSSPDLEMTLRRYLEFKSAFQTADHEPTPQPERL